MRRARSVPAATATDRPIAIPCGSRPTGGAFEQQVAGLCLALLPAQAPPLLVGLALLRLAGMAKRFGTHELRRLLQSVERNDG